jgi:uncharacterized pyridoxal phosphate-containing UPF0001 family protein
LIARQAECDGLILAGLMCIGKYGEDSSDDFKVRCMTFPMHGGVQMHRVQSFWPKYGS